MNWIRYKKNYNLKMISIISLTHIFNISNTKNNENNNIDEQLSYKNIMCTKKANLNEKWYRTFYIYNNNHINELFINECVFCSLYNVWLNQFQAFFSNFVSE